MPTTFFKKIENTTAITALGVWEPSDSQLSEDDEMAKHAPFNHLTVYNNSDKDAEVRLNGANVTDKGVEFLPAGSALVFDKQDDIRYLRPVIYNRDTALSIAANEIILEVRRVN
tara:strand:+ start:1243 stop:1584 length:342 start_codon:yes stop_codon:yes gene_type:complete